MVRGIIYKLVDPDDQVTVFYVGETAKPLKHRLVRHIQSALLHPRNVAIWISGLLDRGRCPLIVPLEEVSGTKADRMAAERRWIEKLKSEGQPLLNCVMGPKDPKKVSEGSRRAWAGYTAEEKQRRCLAISKGLGGDARRERCAKILELLQGGSMSVKEIEKTLQVKYSTLSNDINDLKQKGLIRREGRTRRARWFLV